MAQFSAEQRSSGRQIWTHSCDAITLPNNLNGQVALVTDASRGIGRAIAIKLAELGANVVVNYNGSAAAAAEVVAAIKALGNGAQAVAIQADVSSVADADRLVAETVKAFGRLDVLVNNAGVFRGGATDQLLLDDYHKLIGINIHGVYYTTRAAIPVIADGGAIINISSIASKSFIPGYPNVAYSATKGFVDALTRGVAAELSPRRIRVNTVSPGPTHSDMASSLGEQRAQQLVDMSFFKRLGTPEDTAEAFAFLAVPRSGAWFTGQNLVSAGGAVFSL
ncbi:hypothetical protein HK105_200426 [Polyrhizophydium stewartii]|uniref:3-oxoacyl-[acyl-carrier protein] reductase n=1 Tax=Polyrhizophydium stewartii TaxID=2732419 RepID=A0ABR4NLE6_9FUNG